MTDSDSPFGRLHPAVQYHIVNSLGWGSLHPTQLEAIAPILEGVDCLILAPTAGGKTEAALMPVLSRMLSEDWRGLSVLYVCPIKALLNNLEPRLARYAALVGRTVGVWHGDVSDSKKSKIRRASPDILLTTPESIEGMLISRRLDKPGLLGQVRVVIVDELHAFAGDDRGWHLRAVLTRLEAYTAEPAQRVALSATLGNPEQLLRWLSRHEDARVVGQAAPPSGGRLMIDHVGVLRGAATVISRLYKGDKRLVFCDSRAKVEELASLLRALDVRTFVSHSSLSLSERRAAEEAFAEERDCVIVATSTLELGIDVGDLDHVLQIDAPSTVSSLLQRMGRTGRRRGLERNCTFLTTSEEALLIAAALCHLLARGYTEPVTPPESPWHIVAQQAMALVLERQSLPRHEGVRLLTREFPELPSSAIGDLIAYLLSQDILWENEGLLWFGKKGERELGGRNFLELVSAFTSPTLLQARFGAAEIGFVDPVSIHADVDGPAVLSLGGRSWRVQSVDWNKRLAWVEPVGDQGRSRWLGSSRALGFDVCQAVKRVLLEREVACDLSRRAAARLEQLYADFSFLSTEATDVTFREDGTGSWWTFAGGAANAALAAALQAGGRRARTWDDFSVRVERDFAKEPLSENMVSAEGSLSESEKRFADNLKFSTCLPPDLLGATVRERLFAFAAAERASSLPLEWHDEVK